MSKMIKGVTIMNPINTSNPEAKANAYTIIEFFSQYLGDRDTFYSLWVDENPAVITPFISEDCATTTVKLHEGWDEVKKFFDAIFYDMKGTFLWTIEEFFICEDPNTIITKSTSQIDIIGSGVYGGSTGEKHIAYNGTYVQIFRFINGKVKSFEEYYDTALLNSKYGD